MRIIGFKYLFVATLAVWLISCSEEPEDTHDYKALRHLKQDTSEIGLPLVIPMSELEQLANKALTTPLLTNSELPANYRMVVEKEGELTMSGFGEGIEWQIPVRLQLEQSEKKNEVLYFSLVMTVRSEIALGEAFTLITNSTLVKLNWIKRPEIDMGFMALDLSGVVEKKLWENKDAIEKRIDEALSSKVDLRPVVDRVWRKMHKPLRLSQKVDHTTLYVEGISFAYAQPEFEHRAIIIPTELTCSAMAFWGRDTLSAGVPPLPNPKLLDSPKDEFTIQLLTVSRFEEVESMLLKEFGNQPYTFQDVELVVQDIKMGGYNQELCFEFDLVGDYELVASVCAEIGLDSASKTLRLTRPKIEVLEGDVSVSLGIEVLEDYLLAFIEEEVKIDLSQVIANIPDMIYRGVERGKSGDKVDVLVEDLTLGVSEYRVHKEEIEVFLNASGNAQVDIEKLKKR